MLDHLSFKVTTVITSLLKIPLYNDHCILDNPHLSYQTITFFVCDISSYLTRKDVVQPFRSNDTRCLVFILWSVVFSRFCSNIEK